MLGKRRDTQRHASALAAIARMEMELGTGDWRATVGQLHELIDQMAAQTRTAQSETGQLIDEMRRRINRLEAIIHRREQEYDALQEQVCAKVEAAHLERVVFLLPAVDD